MSTGITLSQFETAVNNIRSAPYGRDVREAIATGLTFVVNMEHTYQQIRDDIDDYVENIGSEIDAALAPIERDINTLQNQSQMTMDLITDYVSMISTIERDIDTLQASMTSAESDIDTLQNQSQMTMDLITDYVSMISAIESDIDSLETGLSTANTDIESLGNQITEVKDYVDEKIKLSVNIFNPNTYIKYPNSIWSATGGSGSDALIVQNQSGYDAYLIPVKPSPNNQNKIYYTFKSTASPLFFVDSSMKKASNNLTISPTTPSTKQSPTNAAYIALTHDKTYSIDEFMIIEGSDSNGTWSETYIPPGILVDGIDISSIPSLVENVTTNATNIAANTTGIAANTTGIAANTTAITAVTTELDNIKDILNIPPPPREKTVSGTYTKEQLDEIYDERGSGVNNLFANLTLEAGKVYRFSLTGFCDYENGGYFTGRLTSNSYFEENPDPRGHNYFKDFNTNQTDVRLPLSFDFAPPVTLTDAKFSFSIYKSTTTVTVKIEDVGATNIIETLQNSIAASAPEVIKQKKSNLVYKGPITDDDLRNLSSPTINDAYLYSTNNLYGVYKNIVQDGDIIYYDGSGWVGLSANPPSFDVYENERHYDVVILGGGAGGIGAAYALKNSGYSVCIVENLDSLGGTHTNGGVIQLLPSPVPDFLKYVFQDEVVNHNNKYASFTSVSPTGSSSESSFDKTWRGSSFSGRIEANPFYLSKKYFDDLSPYIDILLGCKFVSATENNGVIKNVTIHNNHTGKDEVIWGEYFIDATSFASLCIYNKTLGTDYYRGTDPKTRFNEDAITAGYAGNTLAVNAAEADYMYAETTVDHVAPHYKDDGAFNAAQGTWPLINTSSPTTLKIVSTNGSDRIERYIFNPAYGADYDLAVNQSKNNTKQHFAVRYGTTSKNLYIKPMPLIAMRETNRIKCERMLTQDDLGIKATSSNYRTNRYISLSAWGVDLHGGTPMDGITTESYNAIVQAPLIGCPYECLIPVAFKNVLVGSKCFGASHIAASSFRLTRCIMGIGYAAGKAAKLAMNNYASDFRDINITSLQTEIGIGAMLTDIETYFNFS